MPKTFAFDEIQPAPCRVLEEAEEVGTGLLPNDGQRLKRVAPWYADQTKNALAKRPETSVSKAKATLGLWCCCFYNIACCCCTQLCGPWCGDKFCIERAICARVTLRRDLWLGIAHFVCFVIHTIFAVWSFAAGYGKPMEVTINRVVPTWNSTGRNGYDYSLQPDFDIRVDTLCGGFFTLSAVFHFIWVSFGSFPASIPYLWRNIDRAIVATRWIEYSFSASLMLVAICIITGTRDEHTIFGVFMLCFTTQFLGLITEMLSRPEQVGVTEEGDPIYNMDKWAGDPDPVEWKDFNVNYAAKKWRSYSYRLLPHFVGWVPYLAAWFMVLSPFLRQIFDLPEELRNRIPGFVVPAVTGTFMIFSLFSFVQLRYQWTAPKHYWRTELWYCLLSATAKVYLGGLLLSNVLLLASVDEALSL